jgi:hypothetical protein
MLRLLLFFLVEILASCNLFNVDCPIQTDIDKILRLILNPVKAVSVSHSSVYDHRWAGIAYYNEQPTVVGGYNGASKVATMSETDGWQDDYPGRRLSRWLLSLFTDL